MRIAELRGLTLHLGNECTLVTRRCMDAGLWGEETHTKEQQLQHPPASAAHIAHRGCPGPPTSTTTPRTWRV